MEKLTTKKDIPYTQYSEAIRRLQEIGSIVYTDLLSGKAKMRVLTDLLSAYETIDKNLEIGETGTNTDMYFGESREILSLGCYSRQALLNLKVDVLNSHIKHTSPQ